MADLKNPTKDKARDHQAAWMATPQLPWWPFLLLAALLVVDTIAHGQYRSVILIALIFLASFWLWQLIVWATRPRVAVNDGCVKIKLRTRVLDEMPLRAVHTVAVRDHGISFTNAANRTMGLPGGL